MKGRFSLRVMMFQLARSVKVKPFGRQAGLDTAVKLKIWPLREKRLRKEYRFNEQNRVSRRPAYVKENPRPGYAIWETKTRDNRVRQLPTDHLSCENPRIKD